MNIIFLLMCMLTNFCNISTFILKIRINLLKKYTLVFLEPTLFIVILTSVIYMITKFPINCV